MQKIVINKCFGGFSLSREAVLRLRELGHEDAKKEVINSSEINYQENRIAENLEFHKQFTDLEGVGFMYGIQRDDPMLIKVVEELGEKASSSLSSLKIVEIPNNIKWHIEEYDGYEHIAEDHETWG